MRDKERIFISYRRSDTEGYAGRLADSLTAYFGEERVFRDVGGIGAGEDFVEKINRSVKEAAVVLVLIGPDWLAQGDQDQPRLHDSGDHVAAEIAAALDQDRLVIPVLVQRAQMPRSEDLPTRLRDLVRRNAVSISDEGWKTDTTRLANVLALDVSGSLVERKLARLQYSVLLLLAIPMIVSFVAFSRELGGTEQADELIRQGFNTINVVSILGALVLLAATANWFHRSKRKFLWAAVVAGFGGGLTMFVYYLITNDETSRGEYLTFTVTSIIMIVMLVLISLSRFKPSDQLR